MGEEERQKAAGGEQVEDNDLIPSNLDEAVEDLETRFLLILSDKELEESDRLFFQLEQAWWFYEDFLADNYDHLPHFRKFSSFAEMMFKRCVLLKPYRNKYGVMWSEFQTYKHSIPTYGAILINKSLDKVVLVCPYNGKAWSFPKGKVNQGEDPLDCALREVYEETGLDVKNKQGGCTVCEKDKLEYFSNEGKVTHLYIVQNVPEDIELKPRVRKEIGDIKWFRITELPQPASYYDNHANNNNTAGAAGERVNNNKFWQVGVFCGQLKRWIKRNKLKEKQQLMQKTKQPSNSIQKQQLVFEIDVAKVLAVMRPYLYPQ